LPSDATHGDLAWLKFVEPLPLSAMESIWPMLPIDEAVYERYLDQLLSGDFRGCKSTMSLVLERGTTIRDVYQGLFQRSLYEVGRRWEGNLISVAVEHVATAITETLMGVVAPEVFARPSTQGTAVVACVAGELHSIGARMIADVLQLNGWNAHFLGANVPGADLAAYVKKETATLVGLSISLRPDLTHLPGLVGSIRGVRPDVTLVVGGQGFGSEGPALAAREGVQWVADVGAFEDYLREHLRKTEPHG
jgi:methanogenic corrinoid protein MtbC1